MSVNSLKRYWFEFEGLSVPNVLNLGCGVTAHDIDDEKALIQEMVDHMPSNRVTTILENVDVSTLEANHVLPNIGNVMVRGIWFPKRY